jgi:hypothetical protein
MSFNFNRQKLKKDFKISSLAGVSGMVAATITHPIDTVKIQM